jgi:hypothetical protein
MDLAGTAIEAIPILAGAGPTGREFDFAIFTGDLISHDNHDWPLQLGRTFIDYEGATTWVDFYRKYELFSLHSASL